MKVPLRAKDKISCLDLLMCATGERNVPLDGDVEVGDVVQDEPDELLVLFLAEPLDKALRLELLAETDRSQAVLGKAKVKVVGDCSSSPNRAFSANNVRQRHRERGSGGELTVLSVDGKLLGDLGEVGSADEADHGLLANLLEEVEHLGRSSLRGRSSKNPHQHARTHARHKNQLRLRPHTTGRGQGAVDICRHRHDAFHETRSRWSVGAGMGDRRGEGRTKEADDIAAFALRERNNRSHLECGASGAVG